MMPKMTREQFEQMTLEELADWAFENIDYVHHEDALIDLAKREIDKENLNVAIHILTGVYESEEAVGDYYIYDRCMGTLEAVVPITCKEDLEDYIDFEDEEEDEFEDNDFDPDGRRKELPWDYGRHFNEEDEDA